MENNENLASHLEQEQRIGDLRYYLAGIDVVFGIRDCSETEVGGLLEKAESASARQFGKDTGEVVYLNKQMADNVTSRLGPEATKSFLSIFKTEIEDKVLGVQVEVSEGLKVTRDNAREQLFSVRDIQRVTF